MCTSKDTCDINVKTASCSIIFCSPGRHVYRHWHQSKNTFELVLLDVHRVFCRVILMCSPFCNMFKLHAKVLFQSKNALALGVTSPQVEDKLTLLGATHTAYISVEIWPSHWVYQVVLADCS